jgi:hypothetical protein
MAGRDLSNVAPKMFAALEKVSLEKESTTTATTEIPASRREQAVPKTTAPPPASTRPVPKNLLNFNAKLLEKVCWITFVEKNTRIGNATLELWIVNDLLSLSAHKIFDLPVGWI